MIIPIKHLIIENSSSFITNSAISIIAAAALWYNPEKAANLLNLNECITDTKQSYNLEFSSIMPFFVLGWTSFLQLNLGKYTYEQLRLIFVDVLLGTLTFKIWATAHSKIKSTDGVTIDKDLIGKLERDLPEENNTFYIELNETLATLDANEMLEYLIITDEFKVDIFANFHKVITGNLFIKLFYYSYRYSN